MKSIVVIIKESRDLWANTRIFPPEKGRKEKKREIWSLCKKRGVTWSADRHGLDPASASQGLPINTYVSIHRVWRFGPSRKEKCLMIIVK